MEHDSNNSLGLWAAISTMGTIQRIVEKSIEGYCKEINRIEALRLSYTHGELTLTLVLSPWSQKFCPEEEASDSAPIMVIMEKRFILLQATSCMSEKIYFLLWVFSEVSFRTDYQMSSGQAAEVRCVKHFTRATRQQLWKIKREIMYCFSFPVFCTCLFRAQLKRH